MTPGSVAFVTFLTPKGEITRQLSAFQTSHTFRTRLRFLEDLSRPAVVRFERIGEDRYRVDARAEARRGYAAWLSRCTEEVKNSNKRYGLKAR